MAVMVKEPEIEPSCKIITLPGLWVSERGTPPQGC